MHVGHRPSMQVLHFAQDFRTYSHVLHTADNVSLGSFALRVGMSTDSGRRQLRLGGVWMQCMASL